MRKSSLIIWRLLENDGFTYQKIVYVVFPAKDNFQVLSPAFRLDFHNRNKFFADIKANVQHVPPPLRYEKWIVKDGDLFRREVIIAVEILMV